MSTMIFEMFIQNWKNPETPLKWILYVLIFTGILIFFIVLLTKNYISSIKSELEKKAHLKIQYQEKLIANSITIQEKERVRIAGNIHDDLIAQLYQIQLLNNNGKLSDLILAGIQTARKISHDLSPPLLKENSLNSAFEIFLTPFKKEYSIDFFFRTQNAVVVSSRKKLHLFRIFQEIIINAVKHSQTKSIDVQLRITGCYIVLSVQDSGIGFSGNIKKGLGMKNIELRARQLDAIYKFKTNTPSGTRFLLICKNHGQDKNSHS
ncbi:MAG: hypothetical protein GKR88_18920 [Flavobacteriaceae bacterium]|nr:MAG: hypothetical protein GKR88_18920 [Flavobacteriaceae bacterium]